MPTDRLQRLLPLSGVLFTAVLVAGLVLTSGEPDSGASRADIYAYWHSHHGVQMISDLLLIPFGVVFLLGFTATLRRALRSGEAAEAVYSPLALAGGITASVGLLVTGMLGAAVTTAAHNGAHESTYTLAQLQSYDWVPWMVGFAVLLLASGLGGLRTAALPKWLAVAGIVMGLLFLTPVGYFALFVFPLWTLLTGLALYRRGAVRTRMVAPALATLAALVVAGSALATPPGTNGRIAYRQYFTDDHSWGAVFLMNADGTAKQQITHPPKGVFDDQPDWAPDGSALVFTRCKSDPFPCLVYTVAPDGSGLHQLSSCPPNGKDLADCTDDSNGSFSPDSRRIVFTEASGDTKKDPAVGDIVKRSSIAVMNRDGTSRRRILSTLPYTADLMYPIFSPDGKRIAFERDNSSYAKPKAHRALFVMNADGTNVRRITPWGEDDGDNPDWSPDGQWILYRSHSGEGGGQSQYFIVHPDGTGRRQLSHYSSGTHVGSGSFSPDGTSITFAKGPEGGNVDVFTMKLDGTGVQRLTTSPLWDSAPDWGAS